MYYEYKAYCKSFPVISYIFIGFFCKTLNTVFQYVTGDEEPEPAWKRLEQEVKLQFL